jgi:hypothetical protein
MTGSSELLVGNNGIEDAHDDDITATSDGERCMLFRVKVMISERAVTAQKPAHLTTHDLSPSAAEN